MGARSRSTSASVLIGFGCGLWIVGIVCFVLSVNYVLGIGALALGTGSIQTGLTNNYADQSARGRKLAYSAVALMVIGAMLVCLHFYGITKI